MPRKSGDEMTGGGKRKDKLKAQLEETLRQANATPIQITRAKDAFEYHLRRTPKMKGLLFPSHTDEDIAEAFNEGIREYNRDVAPTELITAPFPDRSRIRPAPEYLPPIGFDVVDVVGNMMMTDGREGVALPPEFIGNVVVPPPVQVDRRIEAVNERANRIALMAGPAVPRVDRDGDGREDGEAFIQGGGLHGGAIQKALLQQLALSAYSGKTRLAVGSFKLIFASPTLKFYKDTRSNLIVVSIRGTDLGDPVDINADLLAFQNQLRTSERYRRDRATIQKVQQTYPPSQFRYIAVGHSLGGAILDLFLRDGFIRNGLSYNPLVEASEMGGNPLHSRIYHKDDPLYKWFGYKIPNVEVRTTAEPFWKYALKSTLPVGIGELFQYYDRHKLRIFKGGAIQSAFQNQLREVGIDPATYLAEAKAKAKKAGYDETKLEFSDNKTHKLRIETPEGKTVRFGRVDYNDNLIWSHLERKNQVPKGTANDRRDRFWKSHTKIKGQWKKNRHSPNCLALLVLW